MRGRFGSSVYICRIFFFSFQVIQRLQYDFPGLLFAEIFELAKNSHGGEADCKELVNP